MVYNFFVIETNCIRQPERQPPSSSYNHKTQITLRTSVRDSLASYLGTRLRDSPACINHKSMQMEVPYCNFEVHLL